MSRAGERREEIANYVIERGEVRIDELVEHLGVSRMTVHRHIDRLAHQGVLRKLHGAVTAQPSGIYEGLFRYRENVAVDAKRALAERALQHVEPGQVVMLDDSTTCCALAARLAERAPLTVVTNSVASADRLQDAEDVDLLSLGGAWHRTYHAYIGLLCERAIQSLRADVMFCSVSAIDATTALIQDPQIVQIKRAMMASASRRVLLVDRAKFDQQALHVLGDLGEFDSVLVAGKLEGHRLRALEQAGVRLENLDVPLA